MDYIREFLPLHQKTRGKTKKVRLLLTLMLILTYVGKDTRTLLLLTKTEKDIAAAKVNWQDAVDHFLSFESVKNGNCAADPDFNIKQNEQGRNPTQLLVCSSCSEMILLFF